MGSIDSISSSNRIPRLSYRPSSLSKLIAIFYGHTFGINEWTWSKKEFEDVLKFDDFEGPVEKVAAKIPGMTLDQINQRCKLLVDDLNSISKCHVPAVHPYQSYEQMRAMNNDPLNSSKGMPWSEEEHRLFLMGLKKHGKGHWKKISRSFVITRTPTQVASHAQKYFLRLKQPVILKVKGRSSVLDIQTIDHPPKNKKGKTSRKNTRKYKRIVPSSYPQVPTIRTHCLNNYPWESSMACSQYVSPIMPLMARSFAPMPPFLGQPYGNFSNNLLNGLNHRFNGSNFASNTFTPVLNNSNYASNSYNYVPSCLNIVPQGFPSTGSMSNYVPTGPILVPYGMVSDTFNVDPPNFGFDGSNYVPIDSSNVFPNPFNYLLSDSGILSMVPRAMPNTLNRLLPNVVSSLSCSPIYILKSMDCVSNDTVPRTYDVSHTMVSDTLNIGSNGSKDMSNDPNLFSNGLKDWPNGPNDVPDARNLESDNLNYLGCDFCELSTGSTDVY
ncbi:hypothetical protein GIB67_026730 [Kingdonia uniflora]|uniref:Uncharacterized protein n=1 Tax=Kingdonia uniflora TaxID=39325 RepID=A0A7J7MHN3_9MAGN|nr:hypothetical protein GIB67_026730 [Kingdonia uniflora]